MKKCFVALFLLFGVNPAISADSSHFDPLPIVIQAQSPTPVGTVIAWPAASSPPDAGNWLECNGQSTSGYPALAAIVGPTVPNYQGMFLRGYGSQNHTKNNGSTVGSTSTAHTSSALGQVQGDAVRNIHGYITFHGEGASTGWFASGEYGALTHTNYGNGNVFEDPGWGGWLAKGVEINASRMVPTANENRPANIAVRYLIRAR